MRKSACLFSRWFGAFLALTILAGILAACGDSSPTVDDRESVTIAPEPTSTVFPAEATAAPGASTLPVVAVQATGSGENGSTSNGETSRLPEQQGNGIPPAVASSDAEALLAAFEEVLSDIYESALPSVVFIRVPNPLPPLCSDSRTFPMNCCGAPVPDLSGMRKGISLPITTWWRKWSAHPRR